MESKFGGKEVLIMFVFIAPLGGSAKQKEWSGIREHGGLVGQWCSKRWQRGCLFTILAWFCPFCTGSKRALDMYN